MFDAAMIWLPVLVVLLLTNFTKACVTNDSLSASTSCGELCLAVGGARLRLISGSHSSTLSLVDGEGTVRLSGELGLLLPHDPHPKINHTENQLEVVFSCGVRLRVSYLCHQGVDRYDVWWEETGGSVVAFEEQLLLGDSHWYGGGSRLEQLWPIEKWQHDVSAYISGDSFRGYWGGTLERYWLSSAGVAIRVHPDIPLFVGVNSKDNGRLTLRAEYAHPFHRSKEAQLGLQYTVILAENVRAAQDYAANNFWSKPSAIPDKRLFRYPVWSTWARYKSGINQEKVLDFAAQILEHDFRHAQLEIDDDWTPHYGDMEFDTDKFPDARAMVDDLKYLGFRVTLWVHPYASIFSSSIWDKDSAGESLWITVPWSRTIPNIGLWWEGVGTLLDLTNPESVSWFTNSLHALQMKYGIDSFKFDAGEATWLPTYRSTHVSLNDPDDYTRKFVQIAYQSDTDIRAQEVRTRVGSQHMPMFVRLMDKESIWGHNNGLRTIIPNVLTFGLIGYPFVLPDMIGGNAYTGIFIFITSRPDRELYIRWLEVNALLPVMQFSITPWDYDDEVVSIALEMTRLHEKYSDLLVSLAEESVMSGAPIVRPLWWIAPRDPVALTLDSEFLLGDDLLVAPVLEPGQVARDVYLPSGHWRPEEGGSILEGGRWHHNYSAPLHKLPVFTRVSKT